MMTRSFGDLYFKQPSQLVLATPEVKVFPLKPKDMFCVLCTDGILDVLSNQDVVDLALKYPCDPWEAAKNVVRTAFYKGSEDNLTALVVQFGWADKHAEQLKEARQSGRDAGNPSGSVLSGGSGVPPDDFDMFG